MSIGYNLAFRFVDGAYQGVALTDALQIFASVFFAFAAPRPPQRQQQQPSRAPQASGNAFEAAILRRGARGMRELYDAGAVPADFVGRAARRVLAQRRGRALVLSGFYVAGASAAETDGPPGAGCLLRDGKKGSERDGFCECGRRSVRGETAAASIAVGCGAPPKRALWVAGL